MISREEWSTRSFWIFLYGYKAGFDDLKKGAHVSLLDRSVVFFSNSDSSKIKCKSMKGMVFLKMNNNGRKKTK